MRTVPMLMMVASSCHGHLERYDDDDDDDWPVKLYDDTCAVSLPATSTSKSAFLKASCDTDFRHLQLLSLPSDSGG